MLVFTYQPSVVSRTGVLNRNLSPPYINGQGGTYRVCIAPLWLTKLSEAGVLVQASMSNMEVGDLPLQRRRGMWPRRHVCHVRQLIEALQETSARTTNVATTQCPHTHHTWRTLRCAQGPDVPKHSSLKILYGSNCAAMPMRDEEGDG